MKYLSLILILLFITIISSFTGCCCNQEGMEVNRVGTATGGWGGSCTCPDGQVYQVSDNGTYGRELACYGGVSGKVNRFSGPWSGKSVTCAPKIDLKNVFTNKQWKHLANCCVKKIAITDNGKQIWAIGMNDNVYWTNTEIGGGTWNSLPNSCCVTDICFYKNILYGIGTNGHVWKYDGKWNVITNGFVSYITIADDWIYGIGGKGQIYRISVNANTGMRWQQITPGTVTNITIDPVNKNIYGVGTDYAVYKAKIPDSGISKWTKVTEGSVKQIEFYQNMLYGVNIDNTIYVHKLDESSKWEKFDNNPADGVIWIQIHDNYLYAIKTDNTVSKHPIFNELPDPVLGPGKWSSPLPSENATFIKRQNTNITLNPAPAPKQ